MLLRRNDSVKPHDELCHIGAFRFLPDVASRGLVKKNLPGMARWQRGLTTAYSMHSMHEIIGR